MNKDISLEAINKSALAFISAESPVGMHAAIVNEAMHLSKAEYGTLFLYNSETLQKAYSTSPLLKITKGRDIKKAIRIQKIVTEQKSTIEKQQPHLTQNGIASQALIPLSSKKQVFGVLFLYATKENFFTTEVLDVLEIFRNLATLALAKARLQAESKKSLETRDHFISLASHELRTPLTSINGYIQLLHTKMGHLDTQESRWVDSLHSESIRMTNLVKELLDVNRIKQGQFDFIFSDVSLFAIMQKAIERHNITNEDHLVVFENHIPDKKSHIIGDFDKLTEMMSGLLSNAVKFSRPDAEILVSLARTTHAISITVQSFGREMSKQDVAAIFEGFYKTKHPGIEGMGVGLLLAKHIVENHRGKIDITSQKNKGTTVKVSLPGRA